MNLFFQYHRSDYDLAKPPPRVRYENTFYEEHLFSFKCFSIYGETSKNCINT